MGCDLLFYLFNYVIITAVPLFFLISGFLFFLNVEKYSFSIYKKKMKSRVHSLVIPYICWNLLIIVLFLAQQLFLPSLSSGGIKPVMEWGFTDWISSVYCVNGLPICYQFWFIRDLIVAMIVIPVLYPVLVKSKGSLLILLGVLWFFGVDTHVIGLNFVSLFFFYLGAFIGIKKIDITRIYHLGKNNMIYLTYLLIFIIYIIAQYNGKDIVPFISKVAILCGCIVFSIIVSEFTQNGRLTIAKSLLASTFFLYGYHGMAMNLYVKVAGVLLKPLTDMKLCIIYISSFFVVTIVGYILFLLMRKIMPRVTNIITGGR